MPWPYLSGRSKARTGEHRDGDLASDDLNVGELSLDAVQEDGSSRAESLDAHHGANIATMATEDEDFNVKRVRRSSFPRLALMSAWRSPAPTVDSQQQEGSTSGTSLSYRQHHSGSPSVASRSSFSSSMASRPASILSRRSVALSAKHSEADDLELNGVELQEGHATPYTASGLKGGFQCIEPTITSASASSGSGTTGSSLSHRSGSSALFSIFKSGSRNTAEQGSDAFSMSSADTALSDRDSPSAISPVISPIRMNGALPSVEVPKSEQTPADSGYEEFGPDTVIQKEEERQRDRQHRELLLQQSEASRPSVRHEREPSQTGPSRKKDSSRERRSRSNTSTSIFASSSSKQIPSYAAGANASEAADDSGSNVSIPKKGRSRGWFSFNTSSTNIKADLAAANGASTPSEEDTRTPRQERANPYTAVQDSLPPVEIVKTAHATYNGESQEPTASSAAGKKSKTKQSASSKGMSMIKSAGRKRGDSEVSMKEMANLSSQQ